MTATLHRSWWDRPSLRFLLVGGANTAVTFVILTLLSLVMPGWLAFTIAFVIGLGFSVVMTGRWVFNAETTGTRAVSFAAAYLVIYACGLGLVQLLHIFGVPPVLNGLTVLVTAPLGFLAGKTVFKSNRD